MDCLERSFSMATDKKFDDLNVRRVEAILLQHEIARVYFQGELYSRDGGRLRALTIDTLNAGKLELDEVRCGRLFMIPDGSVVWALAVGENQGTPAGLDVRSASLLLAEGEQNSTIVYRGEAGPEVWLDALHIHRMMLAEHAPERLGTVAFGLMAVTAFRLGFEWISLFAAGHGPLPPEHSDAFVGYLVWPKFGFDAEVDAVELNRRPINGLANCHTVQDILTLEADWWCHNGTARAMRFDLAPGSRSWSVLLHYLYKNLAGDQS
jgi:hypothetical protein